MSSYEDPLAEHNQAVDEAAATTAVALPDTPNEIEVAEQARKDRLPIPAHNGLLHPDRWAMFGRIANTVSNTEFVPKSLRGKPAAVMACLLYGDAQGLHPSVALTEIHIVDGKPTMSATLMVGKIRMAGHRIRREEIRNEAGAFVGTTAYGVRGDDGETDSFTFTLEMAARAGLLTKDNWKKYPESMCWARCVSQLARMLFPDVFLGQSAYTSEELGVDETTDDGMPINDAIATGGVATVDEAVTEAAVSPVAAAEPEATRESPEVVAAPEAATEEQPEPVEGELVEESESAEDVPLAAQDAEVVPVIGKPAHWTQESPPTEEEYERAKAFIAAPGEWADRTALYDHLETAKKIVAAFDAINDLSNEPQPEPETDVVDDDRAQERADKVGELAIPKIMDYLNLAIQRKDVPFIRGLLAHEQAKPRPRARLVKQLEEAIEQVEASPEPQPETETPVFVFEPGAGAVEPTPVVAVAERPGLTRLLAAVRWHERVVPDDEKWNRTAMLAAARHVFGRPYEGAPTDRIDIVTLADLTDSEITNMLTVIPPACAAALDEMDAPTLERLAAEVSG